MVPPFFIGLLEREAYFRSYSQARVNDSCEKLWQLFPRSLPRQNLPEVVARIFDAKVGVSGK